MTMESMQTGSDQSQKLAAIKKCAHPHCNCTVPEGDQYCSDYCMESARTGGAKDESGCNCGHLECEAIAVGIAPPLPVMG
jgi:hypothetical protein